MKTLYGVLCIVGFVLPYAAFLPWLADHGLAPGRLLNEIMRSRIGAFAWLDVIVSAVVLLAFIWHDGRRTGMRHLWAPTLGTLTVGVSLGLPLFLLMREYQRGQAVPQ